MSQGIVSVAYIGATIMFILALGGLSQPETSRRGNFYGMFGMLLALLATIIGIVSDNYFILFAGVIIGGSIGLLVAKKVKMTQMPELVAILHSLVGLAAVLVGFANFIGHSTALTGV
ncbi:NAD(P)(+) transhydrogenase (Re/Si-specific) subunit beta, partial [Rhodoferax sp. 4810]|nr:NAD(P)(+) transhydrogenase (Re/Si-specific) subunit beta [Rhodoferax jenense]